MYNSNLLLIIINDNEYVEIAREVWWKISEKFQVRSSDITIRKAAKYSETD